MLKSWITTFKRFSLLNFIKLAEPAFRKDSRCSSENFDLLSLNFYKVSSECLNPKLEPALVKILYLGK